ncbi:hypothetical protein CPB85DRAFT_1441597 [Mucidula mucida]|nr:hypothetical protein CPB85DRAFT_1441597 [Mucidula mucida]
MTMAAPPPSAAYMRTVVAKIARLSAVLPASVPMGMKNNHLYKVFTSPKKEEGEWRTLNTRFDGVFGEDLRNTTSGRLKHLRRGEQGMNIVVRYLKGVDWANKDMPRDIAMLKLQCVVDELENVLKLQISTLNQPAQPYTLRKQPNALPSQPDVLTSSRVAASTVPSLQEIPSANSAAGSTAAQKIGSTATQKKKNAPKKPGPPQTVDLLKLLMPEDEDGDCDYIQMNRRELSQEPVSEFTLNEDGIEEVVHNKQPTVVTGADGKKCCLVVLSEDEDDADFEAEKMNKSAAGEDDIKIPVGYKTESKDKDTGGIGRQGQAKPSGLAASAAIMNKWLEEAKLYPQHNHTQEGFYKGFAAWIAKDDLASTTGKTNGIARLFLEILFKQMYNKVQQQIKHIKSMIAISEGTWTMKAMNLTFASILGSFINDNWEFVQHVLDFLPILDKEHEGQYAAKGLAKILSNWGILDKIIIQKILAVYAEAEDPDIEDYYNTDKAGPMHYNPKLDKELQKMELEAICNDDKVPLKDKDKDFLKSLYGTGLNLEGEKLSPLKKINVLLMPTLPLQLNTCISSA